MGRHGKSFSAPDQLKKYLDYCSHNVPLYKCCRALKVTLQTTDYEGINPMICMAYDWEKLFDKVLHARTRSLKLVFELSEWSQPRQLILKSCRMAMASSLLKLNNLTPAMVSRMKICLLIPKNTEDGWPIWNEKGMKQVMVEEVVDVYREMYEFVDRLIDAEAALDCTAT